MTLITLNSFSQTDSVTNKVAATTETIVNLSTEPGMTVDSIKPDTQVLAKEIPTTLHTIDTIHYQTDFNMHVSKHKERWEWVKIIGIYTASVILNGMGDAMNNSGRKTMGHYCDGASIGLLVASPFLVKFNTKKWYWYLASYISLRAGLFDVSYNITKGLPINFTGSTSPTDITYNKTKVNPTVTRSLLFSIGMSIPIALL